MDIESKVTSLELSKRLKELGVKQKSLFYWFHYYDSGWIVQTEGQIPSLCLPRDSKDERFISAFIASELLELMPNIIDTKKDEPFNNFRFRMEKSFIVNEDKNTLIINTEGIYIVNYRCDSTECAGENAWLERTLTKNIYDANPANALAKLLIWLYENGYIKNE